MLANNHKMMYSIAIKKDVRPNILRTPREEHMKMKMGIIGFGGMGSYHYSNIRDRIECLEVKGVYDVQETRQEAARQNGLIAYGSREELLADPEIELVLVATPNNFHKPISIAALEAGKNVVCEKPVMMNCGELLEVLAVAKRVGKVFTVHQNRRWDKDYVIIKNIYDTKRLGKPYFVESRVQGSKRVLSGWRGRAENGGGMLLDWGIHLLDQLMWMDKNPVVEVKAELFEVYSQGVDDNCKLYVKFEDGLWAMIEVSTNCFIPLPRWHMSLTDGTAVVNDWSCNGKMVELADEKDLGWSEEIVYTEAGPTRTMAPRPRETTRELPLPEVHTDWCDFYKNVVATIRGTASLIVTPEEEIRLMHVVDLLFESAREHRSIKCNI